ncbi:MAG TPA: HEAT repeat domain-containing protein [Vicinamibacterales bacterium]
MKRLALLLLTACLAIPAIGFAQAVRPFEDVVRDLESRDPRVRVEAMRSLARVGHPEAIGPIARLLTDPEEEIQLEALDTLLQFYLTDLPGRTKRVAGLIEVSRRDRAEAAFQLGPFVLLPRPVPDELKIGLAGAMTDHELEIRRTATWTLGALVPPPAGKEAEAALEANLRDPDDRLRIAAARVAGAVRASSLGDALVAAMNDPEPEVQLAAMRALGDIRERRAVRALRERFAFHGRGRFAEAALDGLARIADPDTLSIFQEHVRSRDEGLRRAAFEGLARIGDVTAIRAAEASTADERDRAVRLARAFAISRDEGRGVPELALALASEREAEQAMSYLVELGRPIVPALATHLSNPDAGVRSRIAQVLGLIGGEEARTALEPTLRDQAPAVARAAEQAIARMRMLHQ